MGSREDQATPHPPHLSSLIVRPTTDSGGGPGDYEPAEVHRNPPSYSRAGRFSDGPGYRIRAGSGSPLHHRNTDHHYHSDYGNSGRSHGLGSGRDSGRFRDVSPPHGRGRGSGRSFVRGFDGLGSGSGPVRGDGIARNNSNVRPREGDWFCPDPSCGNLNFARREHCNNCNRPRFRPGGSPRRGYPATLPPQAHPRRFSGPPLDRSPGRAINGYRSPPRGSARDGPGLREFVGGGPPNPRHESRFLDHHHMHRDRMDYLEDNYRERSRFDRPTSPAWEHRDRGRDFNDRKGFERQPPFPQRLPPPAVLPPPRARWSHGEQRLRSRSPIRGPPPKDFRRDMYIHGSRPR